MGQDYKVMNMDKRISVYTAKLFSWHIGLDKFLRRLRWHMLDLPELRARLCTVASPSCPSLATFGPPNLQQPSSQARSVLVSKLPVELLALIADDLEIPFAVLFALSCQHVYEALLPHILRRLRDAQRVNPSWAGDRLVAPGDHSDLHSTPAQLITDAERTEWNFEERGLWGLDNDEDLDAPFTAIYWFGYRSAGPPLESLPDPLGETLRVLAQKPDSTDYQIFCQLCDPPFRDVLLCPADLKDDNKPAAGSTSNSESKNDEDGGDECSVKSSEASDDDDDPVSIDIYDYTAPNLVLRNLSKRQYVRNSALHQLLEDCNSEHCRIGDHFREQTLGSIAEMLIVWTTDPWQTPDRSLSRGIWAGDRLDIVERVDFALDTTDTWEDVSEEVMAKVELFNHVRHAADCKRPPVQASGSDSSETINGLWFLLALLSNTNE
ncbi:hypothetical protein EXIGLDRAFT_154390 [Exidia glandulosa HHB12029]|uniref:Uncharacterized protein n=1 Tax=Exidia glandulosa HHB12029 TaxID=1314781 RepID=A0A166BSD7_EXIGL|nr:hypothetical protein EXIGLDRAFT_154390 [Exidia glandulosa HHB12029]